MLFNSAIYTALLALGISSATAASPTPTAADSWDTIRADTSVQVRQGAYANAFGQDGFFNACIFNPGNGKDVEFRNIRAIPKSCTPPSLPNGAEQCTYFDAGSISLPVNQTIIACVKYSQGSAPNTPSGCVDYETLNFTIPTTQVFSIMTPGLWVDSRLLFSKPYTIQNCAPGFTVPAAL